MNQVAEKFLTIFEKIIITILIFSMILGVGYATFIALQMVYINIITVPLMTNYSGEAPYVQHVLYRMFGTFITILLGLELINTVKFYFEENVVKIELILVISILALSRHIMQFNFEHMDPLLLLGLAALMAVLITGYIYLKKNSILLSSKNSDD